MKNKVVVIISVILIISVMGSIIYINNKNKELASTDINSTGYSNIVDSVEDTYEDVNKTEYVDTETVTNSDNELNSTEIIDLETFDFYSKESSQKETEVVEKSVNDFNYWLYVLNYDDIVVHDLSDSKYSTLMFRVCIDEDDLNTILTILDNANIDYTNINDSNYLSTVRYTDARCIILEVNSENYKFVFGTDAIYLTQDI